MKRHEMGKIFDGVKIEMNIIKRLCFEEDGQGMVEYTLVVLLVALVFWIGVKNTEVGESLGNAWQKVMDCVTSPASCSA